MELNLKKAAVALVALGLSGVASAAMYAPAPAGCTNHAVTVPCEREGWDLGIEGFYVRAHNNDLFYSEHLSVNESSRFYSFDKDAVSPEFHFGFRVEGSYHFSTGNDVTVNWLRFHHSDDDTVEGGTRFGRGFHVFFTDTVGTEFDNYQGSARFDFDEVNVEMGQHVDVGPNVDMRLHAGLTYAHLDQEFDIRGWTSQDKGFRQIETDSEFRGVGIRTGFDGAYEVGSGFRLTAHGTVSIFAARMRNWVEARDYAHPSLGTQGQLYSTVRFELSERVITPAASARIGVAYQNNGFTVEGGWMINHYWDVIKHYPNDLTNDTSGAVLIDGQNLREVVTSHSSNFGIHGPFLSLKYVA